MSSVPTSTPTMPAGNRFGRHFVLGAAVGGLIIAGTATALWARENGGSSPRVENVAAPSGGVFASPRTATVESTTIFVSSEAEFAEMQSTLPEINAIRGATGEAPLTVVLVGSEGFGNTATGRAANIAEGYEFSGGSAAVTSSFPMSTEPVSTVYIVGSEAEANYLRMAMADSDSIRAATGLAPLDETVVVVSSDAEAEMIRAGLADANSIRAATGEPSFDETVVDLRAE